MKGRLSGYGKFHGGLSGTGVNSGILTIPRVISSEIYEGPYDAVPNFTDQKLETNGKTMADDVTVYAIPVSYTENVGGGYTVFIGGILENV